MSDTPAVPPDAANDRSQDPAVAPSVDDAPAPQEASGPGLGSLEGLPEAEFSSPRIAPEVTVTAATVPAAPAPVAPVRWWPGVILVLLMAGVGYAGWRWYVLPRTNAPQEITLPPGDAALLPEAVRPVTPTPAFEDPDAPLAPEPTAEVATDGPAYPVTPPATLPSLPTLAESDALALGTLQELAAGLMPWLVSEHLIQTFVVTVDNLTADRLPPHRRLVKPLGGQFLVTHAAGGLQLDPANAARYTPLVNALTALDPARVAMRYREVYPLVQQAWVELGNPDSYFNDRLMAVLDHLLAARPPQDPVGLVQPKVFYRFADDELEGESAGRRALFRLGPEQMLRIQDWLGRLRSALAVPAP